MKRQTFQRKFADEPRQVIPLALRRPELTVKESSARGWLAKVAVARVVLAAVLVRGFIQPRGATSVHVARYRGRSKSSVVPTPEPVSLDLPSPVGRDNS